MEKNLIDNSRKEIKFLIPVYAEAELKSNLALQGWHEVFTPRIVHSIYFDTFEDDFLYDSIYGISSRRKYRARWYNDEQHFVIEKKSKEGVVGMKQVSELFVYSGSFPEKTLLQEKIRGYTGLDLFYRSFVSYRREYFYHPHLNSRITIDFNLKSTDFENNIKREINSFFIVEVKALIDSSFLLSFGQFQSRFSKYCFSRVGDDSFY